MAWNVGGAGAWGGLANASQNALGIGMNLIQMRQQQAHQQALEANAAMQTQMQMEGHQMNMAKANLELKKAREQEAALNQIIDIKVNPLFLQLPDSVKPKALEYFDSIGATKGGVGKYKDVIRGMQMIDGSKELFTGFMGEVIKEKQNGVMAAWDDLAKANDSGDPKKIQIAQATFQKVNGEYHAALGKYTEHIDNLTNKEHQTKLETMKEMSAERRHRESISAQLKAAQIRANNDQTISEKAVLKPMIQQLPKMQTKAQESNQNVEKYEALYKMADKGAAGLVAGVKANLAPALEAAGFSTAGVASEAQAYQLMARIGAAGMRQALIGPGQVSNYEQDLMQKISGGSAKTSREAAKALFKFYANEARKDVQNYNDVLSLMPPEITKYYRPIGTAAKAGGGADPLGIR